MEGPTVAVPMGRHKIGNFMFEKIGGKLPFRVREDYQHTWKETPILGPSAAGPPPLVITKRLGDVVVTFNDATDVILHEDYRWTETPGLHPTSSSAFAPLPFTMLGVRPSSIASLRGAIATGGAAPRNTGRSSGTTA